jgi:hypothetical protein
MTFSTASLDVNELLPGFLLRVETTSRDYRIECLGGGAILISGHPQHCPDPVPARLQGSVDREGILELGLIQTGMRLVVFLNGDSPITTSKVLRVRLDRMEKNVA